MKGLVIKNTGSWYVVKTDIGELVECKVKGSFRLRDIKSTNPVVVGDRVEIIHNSDDIAFITEIEERKNYIIRRSSNLSKQSHILAANLDLSILIITIKYPETTTIFIDRFLVSARAYRIPVELVFNKIDLYDEEKKLQMEKLIRIYSDIGYRCLCVSSKTGYGMEEIKKSIANKITLFSGHSGVGKSTLINSLSANAAQKVGEISASHHKGIHTTTFSEMFSLENGGYIIDAPGIKGFGLFDMETKEISHYFQEIFEYSSKCKYNDCTHQNEPECAVIKAVEEGQISHSRYISYLNILEDKDENKYREAY